MLPIALTLGVLVLTFILFIVEWMPVDITAIGIAVLLMLLGLITPEEGIAGFSNSATITVMAMFVLSAAIERTGAIQVVSEFLQQKGGKNPTRQIFVLGSIVGPITAFLNNTAVVAVFIPIVENWCRKQNISTSKLLIPLSYATVLGGTITVIGTSTNVVASGLSKQLGYGEFGLFEFAPMGLIVFVVGLCYLAFAAPSLLPDRRKPGEISTVENYGLRDYFSEIIVTTNSSLIGQSIPSSDFHHRYDLDVLEVIHEGIVYPPVTSDLCLAAGDILLVRCNRDQLLKLKDERGLEILPDTKFSLESGDRSIAEALIISNSSLIGSSLRELRFRQRYNSTVLAVRRGQDCICERLRDVRLRFGDVLLVQAPHDSLRGLQSSPELLVVEPREVEPLRRDKAGLALAIALGAVLAAATETVPILVSALVGVVLVIATGILRPREIYRVIRWDIIFLLAGLMPLGTAMEKSGATEWLASGLTQVGGHLSGFWLLVLLYGVTTVLTEVLSNNAAVVLMIPIAVKVAETLEFYTLPFMLVVMFAASNSYLTPIGYQTNTMVYGPGGYKFLDFTRVGIPLNMILTFLVPLMAIWFYGLKLIA